MSDPNPKTALRDAARKARVAQPDKDDVSAAVMQRAFALPEYAAASCVMFYVDAGSEVRTRHHIAGALGGGKSVVVPYCVVETNTLRLFRLELMDELVEGAYKILEPRPELRELPHKQVDAEELDLVLVPGLAFDREGGRMGQGKGYYDRLLGGVRPDATLVALAYGCQVIERVPVDAHDVFMDYVVTEVEVIRGRG